MPVVLTAADPNRGWAALPELWPVGLPLAVGGLALFWLLPQPRQRSPLLGTAAGLLALLLGAGLLARTGPLTVEALLFYAFSGLAIAAGTLLVTQRHPARAALSFVMVVLSTCGLFLLLAAPFLMAATIIIYAGAVVVTFLFVLMLAQQEGLGSADARSREPLLATLTGMLLLAAILTVLRGYGRVEAYDRLLAEVNGVLRLAQDRDAPAKETLERMRAMVGEDGDEDNLFNRAAKLLQVNNREGSELDRQVRGASGEWVLLPVMEEAPGPNSPTARDTLLKLRAALLAGRQQLVMARLPDAEGPPDRPATALPLSPLSGTPANTPPGEVRRNPDTLVPDLPADNAAYLGRSLFTDFLLPVELGGTLLLVATVGAIAIAHRRGAGPSGPPAEGATPGRAV